LPPLWHHGDSPQVCVRSGSAARMLIVMARTLDARLVVLGTHRQRPARDALAGTLAERLLSELTCPVLIVHRMPWHAYQNVLLALDCSNASGKAVRAAEALVLGSGARASVVHAYQPPYETMMVSAGIAEDVIDGYSTSWKQRASTGIARLLREVSDDFTRYELILENATTPEAIQSVVQRLNPDLLVLGTRGRGRWGRALLGSVASRMLSSAKSDVLVVPDHAARAARSDRINLDVVPGA
jgi:universal stress protein E